MIDIDINQLSELIARKINPSMLPRRWLTLAEAKSYANIKSTTTIMKWIDAGVIYASKRTGQWIVDRDSIDQWYLRDREF